MAVVEESEYKGNPMIVLRRSAEDRYPFQFGLSKAKLVLDAVEEIKAWVAKQDAERAAKGAEAGAAEA
jgi:hypothetical protein